MKSSLVIAFVLVGMMYSHAQSTATNKKQTLKTNPPTELGTVDWIRSFEKGLAKAEKENKPVFLLFQEVPGCATCRNYGHNVLSHPLIAEAIETLFVPVAIYNNEGGSDAKVLKFYGEPSWNNPVVRIVGNNKKDIVDRVAGNYSKLGVVAAMRQALSKKNLPIPNYLELLHEELAAEKSGTETATFSMYCFWTGEKKLGNLDGVIETQPGFMNSREVVEVEFDPTKISFEMLLKQANKSGCASHVFAEDKEQLMASEEMVGNNSSSKKGTFRIDREPKYYLSKTVYQYVPMTQLQAARANSLVGNGSLPNEVLSPRQIALAKTLQSKKKGKLKSAINVGIQEAWEALAANM